MEPFVLLVFFPSNAVIFVQFKANASDEANCGLVGTSLALQAFQLFWDLGAEIHHLSFSTPKMAFLDSQNATF